MFLSKSQLPDKVLQSSIESERARIKTALSNPLLSNSDRSALRAMLENVGQLKDYSAASNPEGIDPTDQGVIFR